MLPLLFRSDTPSFGGLVLALELLLAFGASFSPCVVFAASDRSLLNAEGIRFSFASTTDSIGGECEGDGEDGGWYAGGGGTTYSGRGGAVYSGGGGGPFR